MDNGNFHSNKIYSRPYASWAPEMRKVRPILDSKTMEQDEEKDLTEEKKVAEDVVKHFQNSKSKENTKQM